MSDIAIKVEHLSKYYKLGVINNGTLFKDIQSYMARLKGKEDPNGKIGARHIDNAEGFWALKDLNFEIKKGDRVGIIGHNGAGKSTLLKVLSQITSPTEGNIKINGRVASLLEVGTGFHPEMTGRENIYMNGAILGMKKSEIDSKVNEIIEFSEIGEHIDTPVKRYSSGMYVRLAFAVAAHLDSEILIADEVLAVGDAAFQKKALGKMNELSTGEGRTVLFVSHNMAQIMNLCNKGILLENGNLIRQDDDINKSIDWYLYKKDDSSKIRKTGSWINKGQFKSRFFCPKSIKFTDKFGNEISKEISYDEDFWIETITEIQEKSNIDYWFEVYKGLECLNVIPGHTEFSQGEKLYRIKVPARTYLPGDYRIVFGASIKNTEWIINPASNDISVMFKIKKAEKNYFEYD